MGSVVKEKSTWVNILKYYPARHELRDVILKNDHEVAAHDHKGAVSDSKTIRP